MISGKEEPSSQSIIKRQRKHTVQAAQALSPILCQKVKNNFSIAGGTEDKVLLLQLLAQHVVVVHFAIVNESIASVRGEHRLMAGRRQVKNGEPPETQLAVLSVAPETLVVRSAAHHLLNHASGRRCLLLREALIV